MWAFVKSFATYRTIRMAAVISSALTLDSLSAENSTVTVVGTEIGQSDAGNWLVIDGGVYSIAGVKPQTDRTLLTLTSPLDAFSRPLELAEQTAKQTIGNFIVQQLTASAGKTASVWTQNKVDLTDYSSVSVKSDSNVFIGLSIIIASAIGSTSGQVATASISGTESELSLDISAITGEYFVWLSAYSEKGSTRYVYEVSLE